MPLVEGLQVFSVCSKGLFEGFCAWFCKGLIRAL